jgi:hypothetical protein
MGKPRKTTSIAAMELEWLEIEVKTVLPEVALDHPAHRTLLLVLQRSGQLRKLLDTIKFHAASI